MSHMMEREDRRLLDELFVQISEKLKADTASARVEGFKILREKIDDDEFCEYMTEKRWNFILNRSVAALDKIIGKDRAPKRKHTSNDTACLRTFKDMVAKLASRGTIIDGRTCKVLYRHVAAVLFPEGPKSDAYSSCLSPYCEVLREILSQPKNCEHMSRTRFEEFVHGVTSMLRADGSGGDASAVERSGTAARVLLQLVKNYPGASESGSDSWLQGMLENLFDFFRHFFGESPQGQNSTTAEIMVGALNCVLRGQSMNRARSGASVLFRPMFRYWQRSWGTGRALFKEELVQNARIFLRLGYLRNKDDLAKLASVPHSAVLALALTAGVAEHTRRGTGVASFHTAVPRDPPHGAWRSAGKAAGA